MKTKWNKLMLLLCLSSPAWATIPVRFVRDAVGSTCGDSVKDYVRALTPRLATGDIAEILTGTVLDIDQLLLMGSGFDVSDEITERIGRFQELFGTGSWGSILFKNTMRQLAYQTDLPDFLICMIKGQCKPKVAELQYYSPPFYQLAKGVNVVIAPFDGQVPDSFKPPPFESKFANPPRILSMVPQSEVWMKRDDYLLVMDRLTSLFFAGASRDWNYLGMIRWIESCRWLAAQDQPTDRLFTDPNVVRIENSDEEGEAITVDYGFFATLMTAQASDLSREVEKFLPIGASRTRGSPFKANADEAMAFLSRHGKVTERILREGVAIHPGKIKPRNVFQFGRHIALQMTETQARYLKLAHPPSEGSN